MQKPATDNSLLLKSIKYKFLCYGLITAGLHVWLGINRILSGILVMFALYSVNLRLMGSANLQLVNSRTAISFLENRPWIYLIIFLLVLSIIGVVLIMLFFR